MKPRIAREQHARPTQTRQSRALAELRSAISGTLTRHGDDGLLDLVAEELAGIIDELAEDLQAFRADRVSRDIWARQEELHSGTSTRPREGGPVAHAARLGRDLLRGKLLVEGRHDDLDVAVAVLRDGVRDLLRGLKTGGTRSQRSAVSHVGVAVGGGGR